MTAAPRVIPASAASRRRSRTPVVLCLASVILSWPTTKAEAPAAEPSAPRRMISIVPAVTEMLFAIGAGPRLVAVGSFDRHPPEVAPLPRVGALLDPDVERILSLRPDLVVVYESQTDLRQQLERAGIPMFVYAHAGLPDVTATLRALGRRVGAAAEGARVASEIERSLQVIRDRVRHRARPRTLLVFGRDPQALGNIYASGGYGFLNDMLEVAGAVNVFADINRQLVQASLETILRSAPEVIVELRYTGDLRQDEVERARSDWKALPSVPAVRLNQVYVLIGDEFVVPGPRIPAAVEKLANAIHGSAAR